MRPSCITLAAVAVLGAAAAAPSAVTDEPAPRPAPTVKPSKYCFFLRACRWYCQNDDTSRAAAACATPAP